MKNKTCVICGIFERENNSDKCCSCNSFIKHYIENDKKLLIENEMKIELINKCSSIFKNDLISQGICNYDENIINILFKDMTIFELKNWIKIDEKLKNLQLKFKISQEK